MRTAGLLPLILALTFAFAVTPRLAAQGSQTLRGPGWPGALTLAPGWSHNASAQGALLGHETIAGLILVYVHRQTAAAAVQQDMRAGLQEESVTLALQGDLRAAGANIWEGALGGWAEGTPAKGLGLGVLGPQGGGFYIIAISTPEGFSPALAEAARALAKSAQFADAPVAGGGGMGGGGRSAGRGQAPGGGGAAPFFVGTWKTFTANSETAYTLYPDGTFRMAGSSAYSGSTTNQYGDQTGAWGAGGDSQGGGRWSVQGNQESGVLTLQMADGEVAQVPYQVHAENGQVYWNEYYFDGILYSKIQ